MKVYAAMHNPCIHESAAVVLSLHETMAGAEKVLDKAKKKEAKFFRKKELPEWDIFFVQEMEILK